MTEGKALVLAAGPRLQADSADDYGEIRVRLMRAVARVCPPWMADHREDIVQAALMRVMGVRRKGPFRRFSSSYLWRTAYSALVDEIRRRRGQDVPLEEAGDGQRAAGPGPEQQARGREIGEAIRSCLAQLVRPRRMAVVLQLQGHTVPEIAHLLGWSPKRAENMVYRGLADLRQRLSDRGLRP